MKTMVPLPDDVLPEIWLWLAEPFQRCMNIVDNIGDDDWTPEHGYTKSSLVSLWLR